MKKEDVVMYNGKPKSLTIKLPADMIADFDVIAKKLGMSKTSMIESLLNDILPTFKSENMLSYILKQNASVLDEVATLLGDKKCLK
jgi:predicted transcriptional regulator